MATVTSQCQSAATNDGLVMGWIQAARSGSNEALGQLLQFCRHYLLLVANEELEADLQAKGGASDLVQQTFLEAQRDFASFRGKSEAELLHWMRRILLHNLCGFARHYRDTDKRRVARELSLDDSSVGPLRESLTSETPRPIERAIAREERRTLEGALNRLSDCHRRVINLRHQENLSFEQIGQIMNRSPEAARKLWARAIERLQQQMESTV